MREGLIGLTSDSKGTVADYIRGQAAASVGGISSLAIKKLAQDMSSLSNDYSSSVSPLIEDNFTAKDSSAFLAAASSGETPEATADLGDSNIIKDFTEWYNTNFGKKAMGPVAPIPKLEDIFPLYIKSLTKEKKKELLEDGLGAWGAGIMSGGENFKLTPDMKKALMDRLPDPNILNDMLFNPFKRGRSE